MRRKHHRNTNGNYCRCPWGVGNADPYTSNQNREVVGKDHTSMWHEASKLEWLRERGDKHPGMDEFLDYLERHVPEHDPLFPWLAREWKKGRLHNEGFVPGGAYQDEVPFHYRTDQGQREGLEGEDLEMLNRWMKYKKQNKQGIDIMQHHISQVMPEASKWDAGGELIYEDPHNGHGVYHLRNKRDLRVEGRRMNHCIGSNGQGYIDKLADGEGLFYSVRDRNNHPLGTLSLDKSTNDYYKCGSCGHFVAGRYFDDRNEEGTMIYGTKCEDCGEPLEETNPETGMYEPQHNTTKHPVDLRKMGKRPDARFVDTDQFYGHNDEAVPEDAVETMNDFMKQHGHSYIYSSAEHEEEEEPEPQDVTDLGYQSTYYHRAPRNLDELRDYDNGDYEGLAPPAWHDAVRAADNHGLEYPELEAEEGPDWEDIFQNMVVDHEANGVNPEHWNELFQIASNQGAIEYLKDHAENWITDDHEQWLDPYGQGHGPGFMGPGKSDIGTYPNNPIHYDERDDEPYDSLMDGSRGQPKKFVHLPGQHYPGDAHPNSEYLHRNLLYQLDKHYPMDPQTGERHELGYGNPYPQKSLYNDERPGYGPSDYQQQQQDRARQRQPGGGAGMPNLPYTGDQEWTNPVDPNNYGRGYPATQLRFNEENDHVPYSQFVEWPHETTYPTWQGEERLPRDQHPPGGPDDGPYGGGTREQNLEHTHLPTERELPRYMTPGMENTFQHQRPFPGMEFGHPSGGNQHAFDPMVPWNYPMNEQQGRLMPPGWYVDYRNQRAHETTLPEHLFPPEHYGYHQQVDPNQTTMWDYERPPGQTFQNKNDQGQPYANINTGTEPPTQEELLTHDTNQVIDALAPPGPPIYPTPPRVQGWQERPFGHWNASTKEAGEWTDYEEAQKVDRKDGYGGFQGINPHQGIAFNNGNIVQFDPGGDDDWYFKMPGFEWRVPALYHHPTGKMYVGKEGMEHTDLARQFALPKPWKSAGDPAKEVHPGFIDLDNKSDRIGLNWYGGFVPRNNHEYEKWVEDNYGISANPVQDDLGEQEIWSSYHPTQEEEWVAEDEPVFSATIPEGRWNNEQTKTD